MIRPVTDPTHRPRPRAAWLAVLALPSILWVATSSTEAEGSATAPESPNPYLSFLPTGARPDYRYWRAVMKRGAAERRHRLAKPERTVMVTESEPNDTQATADVLAGFGTGAGEDSAADVTGSFTGVAAPAVLVPAAEDEGSIPLATETGLVVGSAVRVSGTIGDGPFGSGGTGSGDYDFFRIPGVTRGQLILIDVDTAMPMAGLDTFIALYDSAGNFIRLNEDQDNTTLDSFIALPAPADDDYYVSIGGAMFPFVSALTDPFDSSSGTGVASEGDYDVTLGLEYGDQDWFTFDLETCDILGLNLLDAGTSVTVRTPSGDLRVASAQDLSFAYPDSSTLPGGGNAVLAYIASEPGTHAVRVLGIDDSYTLELRLSRQPMIEPADAKTIFVDFDGAIVDPAIFGGTPGVANLSPLSSFLADWGLTPGDEDAVIDAILATLRENLRTDLLTMGPSDAFAVEILDSRDDADPFGAPDVSRLIIGGTRSELQLSTIGIAQSIDPGNFEAAETGVVLLDALSGPAFEPDSLNSFPLAAGTTLIDLIGVAVGNIAAHEAGHYTGNFHTEQFDGGPESIMDQGGNLPNTLGIGADGIFGNADDLDVDFGEDVFANTEGFGGFEDTLAVISCGCGITPDLFADGFESGDVAGWSNSSP